MKMMKKGFWLSLTVAVAFSFMMFGPTDVGWAAKKTKEQKAAEKVRKKHEAAQKALNKCIEKGVQALKKCETLPEDKQDECGEKAQKDYFSCKEKIEKDLGKKNAGIQKKRDKAMHSCGSKWAKCFKKCKSDKKCKDDCTEERSDCVDKIDDLYPFIEKAHDSDDD